jgi:hypothetical protein
LGCLLNFFSKDWIISSPFLIYIVPKQDVKIFKTVPAVFECLHYKSLIIRGDLNLTLRKEELWGHLARSDVLANFFLCKFEMAGLVDVKLVVLKPT